VHNLVSFSGHETYIFSIIRGSTVIRHLVIIFVFKFQCIELKKNLDFLHEECHFSNIFYIISSSTDSIYIPHIFIFLFSFFYIISSFSAGGTVCLIFFFIYETKTPVIFILLISSDLILVQQSFIFT